MCTTTNSEQSTESTTTPRSISELLMLDTYQGMTDEEIDMIIEYEKERAKNEQIILDKATAAQTFADNLARINETNATRALDILESTLTMLPIDTSLDDDEQPTIDAQQSATIRTVNPSHV